MRSWGSDLSTKSWSERTSREDASHAPGAGSPVQPAAPAGAEAHADGTELLVRRGREDGGGGEHARDGQRMLLGFETWKRRSKATVIALGAGRGPKSCSQRSAAPPSGTDT
jgi:hypothetical protein